MNGSNPIRNRFRHNRIEIIYEDRWFAVIYKPPGLLSVSYQGNAARTALDQLYELRRKRGLISASSHPAAVHRLDRDTSGLMIFAYTAAAKRRLMDNWHVLVSERAYIALCEIPLGAPFPLEPSGVISRPLAYNARNQAYAATGKPRSDTIPAVTYYQILKKNGRYALVRCELETGRKNQIRAHLASYGMPIAGDANYRCRSDPEGRLCLHAQAVAFTHPFTKERLRFEYPAPSSWAGFCV